MQVDSEDDASTGSGVYPAPTPYPDRGGDRRAQRPERRRLGREEGQALERLGHAVEYLIDSRMFLTHVPYTNAEEEAVQILMKMNRLVFEGCPEIVTMRRRVTDGLQRLIHGQPVDRRGQGGDRRMV
jgi:hypothetical protein